MHSKWRTEVAKNNKMAESFYLFRNCDDLLMDIYLICEVKGNVCKGLLSLRHNPFSLRTDDEDEDNNETGNGYKSHYYY